MVKIFMSSLVSVLLLAGCIPQKRKKLERRTDFITQQGEAKPQPTQSEHRGPAKPDSTFEPGTETPTPGKSDSSTAQPTLAEAFVSAPTTPPPASNEETSKPQVSTPEMTVTPNQNSQETKSHELTYEEMRHFFTLMTATYGQKAAAQLLQPRVGSEFDASELEVDFEGNTSNASYRFKHKKQVIVEFKNFKIPLDKALDLKSNSYSLGGICVGSKCEVLFLVLYKVSGEQQISEVYPFIMKWGGKEYQQAEFMNPEKYKEHALQDQNSKPEEMGQAVEKLPPQLRVMHLLEKNRKVHKEQILKSVHARMSKDQALYSARLFVNIKSNSFLEEFQKTNAGIQLNLKIEFTPDEKRKTLNFNGLVKKEGVRIADKSGMTLDIYQLIPDQFLLLAFENTKFSSPIQDPIRAIQVKLCQLLEEEGQLYSLCEFLPSSQVLGIMALEGRVGGPVYVKGQQVQKNGKMEEIPEILKAYTPDFSESQDPGF